MKPLDRLNLKPDDDIIALLPVSAEELVVGSDEVAQMQVCPDIQAFHGALQILRAPSHSLHDCILTS